MQNSYFNANEAFNDLWNYIPSQGQDFDNTKAIFNCGFYIQNPLDNNINSEIRNWKKEYAEAEWQWYLSGDQNIDKLGEIYGKIPPIWERMADDNGNVNSNYGYQWKRNGQLNYIVSKLQDKPDTRHATISIYDGKEASSKYTYDTPCTYAVQFSVIQNKLCMSVYMRSNDLWYGFCNDQYCFSMLQKLVSERLNMDAGWYYHHAHNMHIYNDKLK
jgi:thymidylate synthase